MHDHPLGGTVQGMRYPRLAWSTRALHTKRVCYLFIYNWSSRWDVVELHWDRSSGDVSHTVVLFVFVVFINGTTFIRLRYLS